MLCPWHFICQFSTISNKRELREEHSNKNCQLLIILLILLQAIVLFITLAFAAVGTWGTLSIRQHFDPVLLLPADSYLRQWITIKEKHFPQVRIIQYTLWPRNVRTLDLENSLKFPKIAKTKISRLLLCSGWGEWLQKCRKFQKNWKLWGYLYVMIGSMHTHAHGGKIYI